MTNLLFLLSCVMFVITHMVWFNFFNSEYFPFEEVVAFFLVCVWLVPLSFFIGLSTDETSLPYTSISASGESIGDGDLPRRGKGNMLISLISSIQNKIKRHDRHNDYKNF